AAAPLLINLIGSSGALRDYCIAWALGWCGDESGIEPLGRLYGNPATPDMVRRIAAEALMKLSDDQTRAEFRADMIEKIPRELRELARNGPAAAFAAALNAYLSADDFQRFPILDTIYLVDNKHVRPALLDVLRSAPLTANYFQRMRHIFKTAEYRRDAEVFGILAYRFEKVKGNYYQGNYSWDKNNVYVRQGNGIPEQRKKDDVKKPNAKLAYGDKTRAYLRRRVWRTLRRLGELGDVDYVKMAVGALLPYSDADAQPARESSRYDWETRQTHHARWDAYAPYLPFNHILYGNSPRYFLKRGTTAWRCRPNYRPGDPEPQAREEAFPKLWEQMPVGLLHLLAESNCQPVHRFAVKALAACPQFCDALDLEAIVMLLGRPYEVTAKFAFELARKRYNPASPDLELTLALANCAFAEGRAQAHRWVEEGREHFLKEIGFLAALAASPHADTREFARVLLRSSAIPDEVAKPLIARLIAQLLAMTEGQREEAQDIAETIFKSFGPQLRSLGLNVVLDLLAHPLLAVQELGGNILLNHDTKASELPEEIIHSLIASPYEQMRGIGVKLLGQLPDEMLLERESLLATLSMHELADIRNAARPIIRRLGGVNAGFVSRLTVLFIDALLTPGKDAAAQNHLVQVLRDDLPDWQQEVSKELALRLLQAKPSAAQELGGLALIARSEEWGESFDISELVKLSSHEILAVRQAAWAIFARVHHRCKRAFNPDGHHEEMAKAVRLLDSKWEDSRRHWFEFFRASFGGEDLSPGVLVGICDSVREDVQAFGRALITEYFREEDGQEYMLKLSEHPSADLQLFVTNYLERYAADSSERLKELAPYFVSVLSRVNRARVAKDRIFAFMLAEAMKGEAAARIVAGILTRQSVTIAIGDKAATIEAMLKIRRAYPQIEMPIRVKSVEVRNGI
ncbi:MAG TPA: hypothetical protein VNO70_15330, partial [Blastocatellia bacterium]|nr:hypothetical protein [Blastocatellia bacterium]